MIITRCQECKGAGWYVCDYCSGAGEKECHTCGYSNNCDYCHGTGEEECIDCLGRGEFQEEEEEYEEGDLC